MKKTRHHSVSRFYLRGFATDDLVWTYDKQQDGNCRCSTVAATAFEKHSNTVLRPDGAKSSEVEDFIAGIESKARPALDILLAAGELSGQDRADFASFMAIMVVRTDAWRRLYADFHVKRTQLRMFAAAKDDRVWKKEMDRYQERQGALAPEVIEQLRQGYLHPETYELTVSKRWTLRSLKYHDTLELSSSTCGGPC